MILLCADRLCAQPLEVPRSIGIEPYKPKESSVYRLLAGGGINGGLFSVTPVTEFGVISLRRGTDLFSVAIISDRSTGGIPRRTFMEYDVLYGYAYTLQVAHQAAPPDFYHLSISAGLSLDTYAVRWRQSRRRVGDLLSAEPNTFQYTAGFPVQIQAIFEPLKYFGAGVLAYTNFNSISPNYGLALGLEVRY